MADVFTIFTDGGLIGSNPSPIGGTWAYCHVDPFNKRIREESGIQLAKDWGFGITNNFTELYAIAMSLVPLPDRAVVTLYSDSKISLGRVCWEYKKWVGIPDELREMIQASVERLGPIEGILLDGHPNKAQLEAGIGKRGNKCHEHNVWCDKECTRLSNEYREQSKS